MPHKNTVFTSLPGGPKRAFRACWRTSDLLILTALFFMSALSALSAQQQTLTPELLWQTGRVALECVSADGRYVVYAVQRYRLEENKGNRVLYLTETAGGTTRPLSDPAKSSSNAAFTPDGQRIGFLQDDYLWEIPVGAENAAARQVSTETMSGFKYAPDGRSLLFTRRVAHDLTAQSLYPDLPNTSGRLYDGLFYRHWKSWNDGQYSNIFLAEYADGELKGTPRNIQNEPFDSPLMPFGGMEQITWSPDSRFIVYTSRKLSGTAAAQSTNSDLYVYELKSGKTLNLTEDLPGYDQDPVFSPDGRTLAWTSMARAGYEADRTRLMVLDVATQQRRDLTAEWTFEANHPQWAADSKSLYFLSSENFTYQLYQIRLQDGKVSRLTEGQHDYSGLLVPPLRSEQAFVLRTTMTRPPEVYAIDTRSGAARPLSFVTADPWNNIAKATVERHTVRTTDGNNLNVWMVLPPNFDPKKKYPTLLYCQGGPQSSLSQGFSFRWNFQLMAAQGYVVIAPCRRGMPGAGQAWCDAIIGDWGGGAMRDLLDATDYAAQKPYVDAARMGAVGASFGGYAVYWLAGNHQKRFKSFISHCGLFNLESFYGTTEEVWFPHNDFVGAYWQKDQPEMYRKHSPHRFVSQWDTPILVIHNELDFRVPFGEGMQAFQAAQLRGIRSQFLSFPDEGHWMSKPQNSVLWQRVFFQWLKETMGNDN
jgi:dipeptidyl aminopeptidase/acylaminoacyl peptidase